MLGAWLGFIGRRVSEISTNPAISRFEKEGKERNRDRISPGVGYYYK
jgi:hypothetical protein